MPKNDEPHVNESPNTFKSEVVTDSLLQVREYEPRTTQQYF